MYIYKHYVHKDKSTGDLYVASNERSTWPVLFVACYSQVATDQVRAAFCVEGIFNYFEPSIVRELKS